MALTGRGEAPARRRRWPVVVAVAVVLGGLAVAGRFLDAGSLLATVRSWIAPLGWWAPVAYAIVYVGATAVGTPGLPFTLAAPFLFGPWIGFATMVAATAAASISQFVAARYALRAPLERRLASSPGYARITRALTGSEWFVIPFIRLSPVAFTLTNYALGLCPISFRRFLIWSQLVDVPMNAVWVFGAHAFSSVLLRGEASWWLLGLTSAAGIALLLLGIAVRRRQAPDQAT